MKTSLLACTALVLAASPALADSTDLSFPVHDIIVTSNIPAVNISVRNLSASTDPADRDLRMVSDDPQFNVTGQVWCKSYEQATTSARAAQLVFGNAPIVSTPEGSSYLPLGVWGASGTQYFGNGETLVNFSLAHTLDLPADWNSEAAITLGFNPVQVVEQRLEQYVANNAGSEADFLRVDDVFETSITLNAVGWCLYHSDSTNGQYAGRRAIEVPVHIFYHGDPDIQDVITSVGGANTLTAPVPSRARGTATARGANSQPPATSEPPARARPQRVRTPASDGGGRTQAGYTGGVRVATGDVNNDNRKMADEPKQGRRDRVNGQDEPQAGLLLPAVQSLTSETGRPEARTLDRPTPPQSGNVPCGSGEGHCDWINLNTPHASSDSTGSGQQSLSRPGSNTASAGVEPDEIDNRFEQEAAYAEDCPTVGSVVRREATNAIVGALFGSRANDRNRDRRTTRERLADDAIDRMTQC